MPTSNYYKGLTLLEMTLVLLISSILLAGLISPLQTQIQLQHHKTTEQRQQHAIEALIGFAMIHARLPCPADATLAIGITGAGEEARTDGECDSAVGVLPWVDLGIEALDGWQRRFTYRVTPNFADDDPASDAACQQQHLGVSFALCSKGNLHINSRKTGGYKLAKDLPAVIISHGKNGDGAYLDSGIQYLLANHDIDEEQNFKKQVNFVDARLDNAKFDDLVAWLAPNILAYRLVQAGVLP